MAFLWICKYILETLLNIIYFQNNWDYPDQNNSNIIFLFRLLYYEIGYA